MIDFHTHILPGMDDGSRSISQSVSMLREEARQNMDTVFLTPHFYAEENRPVEFLKRRYSAWRKLAPYLWPELPSVRLGAEVQYFEGICRAEDIQHLRIVGTDLLLLEMPFCRWSDRMLSDVAELNDRRGTQIVLAHIDRYMAIQKQDVWDWLRANGVLMQANVSSFQNRKTRKKVLSMLSEGQIQFLGSDCHNMEARRPNWDRLPDQAWTLAESSPEHTAIAETDTNGIHLTVL